MFNQYYINVHKNILKDLDPEPFNFSSSCKIPQTIFLENCDDEEVSRVIDSLANKKSCGIDETYSFLMKQCREYIIQPLVFLINPPMSNGLPWSTETTIVKPLHKKKDKLKLQNYRPIALLSFYSRLFEKIFLTKMDDFFSKYMW